MSYPSEDRHERDVVGGPARNPTQDMEKHDKSKVLTANPGGIFLFLYSLTVILCVFDTLPSPVRLKRLYEPFFALKGTSNRLYNIFVNRSVVV